jgi:TonB-linked SusC/RagA family outer membrane protein
MRIQYKSLIFTALLLFVASFTYAQFTATGTIKDEAGETLVGATVQEKGTSNGVASDINGNFSINVGSNNAVLVISYTGYASQEVAVSSSNPKVNIVMKSGATDLTELVVVGYGETRKEAITGAVTTLKSDQIEQVPLGSIEQTLQGNVAGLQSNMSNGQPGANVSVRIRGQGSISASSEPLYVIDGIPIASGSQTFSNETSNPLASINPNDIESVSVLKDASATAIYGSRGANGVILITTKSGRRGKPKVELKTQLGFNNWAVNNNKRLRGLTALEYTDLYLEGWINRGETVQDAIDRFNGHYPDPQTGLPAVDITDNGDGTWSTGTVRVDTRWLDELSRVGLNQSYDLSVSGGNDVLTYYASASYFYQEAPIIYSNLDRLSSRLNMDIQATDWLKISNNLNISRTTQQGMNDATRWANPMYNGYLLAPTIPIRDAQGRFYGDHKTFFMGGNNPIGSLSGDDEQQWVLTRIIDNVSADVSLMPGLKFRTAWSLDLSLYDEFYFRNNRYGDGRNLGGYGRESSDNTTNWIGTQTLSYNKTFGDIHNFDALIGYETQRSGSRRVSAEAWEYPPNPDLRTLASAAAGSQGTSTLSEFALESYLSRVGYNYDNKYYVTASFRRDGSSRFGANNRYGNFWSFGASWRLDREGFIQDIDAIQSLKIRASTGQTGNAGIGNYEAIPTFGYSGFEYDGQPGGGLNNIGNVDLTWEKNATTNVGVDFSLFNMLSGTVEWFTRESTNLLLDVPISLTTGFSNLTQNFGSMQNRGWEFTLNVDVLQKEDMTLSLGGNITFLRNQITQLNEEFIAGTKIRREGSDFQTYYLIEWAGVDSDNGDPLWYTDSTMTATTNTAADALRGDVGITATPSSYGGFNANFTWKGLFISTQFTFSTDNYLYDATGWVLQGDGRFTPRSQTNLVFNRWQNSGDVTQVPRFQWGNTSSSNLRNTTRWIYDGTHIRLRNVTIGYNLPREIVARAGMSSARVYFRGINLWTWTRDPDLYMDPEAAFSGVVNSPVPNMATASFGVDIGL